MDDPMPHDDIRHRLLEAADKAPGWRSLLSDAADEIRQFRAVLAERDALRAALNEYGWHHESCPQHPTYAHPERWPACTCGFDAARATRGKEGKRG